MAKYDRRILVPYLNDVYSAELICYGLNEEVEQLNNEMTSHRNAIDRIIVDPPAPRERDFPASDTGDDWLYAIGCCVVSLFAFCTGTVGGIVTGAVAALIAVVFFCSIWCAHSDSGDRFQEALSAYHKEIKENKRLRDQKQQHKVSLEECQQRMIEAQVNLRDAQRMCANVYSVNIIPAQYRNVYVAYYLYDYFSTSRETDLDKIIQMFLLEEIKQKLDKIITQNEQIILNQRYQIALQEQENRALAEHHREELRQIARLTENQELQLDYQNMIAKNQEVTNFILAADYMKKYGERI